MNDPRKYKDNILVRPDNLFYILYYAFCADWEWPDLSELEDVVPDGEFEDMPDLFSGVLEKHIAKLLKQGLYREYLDQTEDLPTIRGKIDMGGTIRNKIARRQLISCEYDELSENTLSNRIIKTAANFLLRNDKKSRHKDSLNRKERLRQEMRYFSNVDEVHDLTAIPWSRLHFHRNNKDYRILIFISRLILKETLLTTKDGEYELESFIGKKQMNTLYEKFLLGYYSRKFPGLRPAVIEPKWAGADYKEMEVLRKLEEPDRRVHKLLPKMKTDITLTYRDKKHKGNKRRDKVLIIDAKWYKDVLWKKTKKKTSPQGGQKEDDGEQKHTKTTDNVGKIRSSHLYQIYAYVKNKEADKKFFGDRPHTVSGMLLYAGTEKGVQPNDSYFMSGNWIYVRTLDFNKSFKEVKKHLDGIANGFVKRENLQQENSLSWRYNQGMSNLVKASGEGVPSAVPSQ